MPSAQVGDERTRAINRLRWHLHELDADWDPPARSLDRASNLDRITRRLAGLPGIVAHLAAAITQRCRQFTTDIDALEAEIKILTDQLAPTLMACGVPLLSQACDLGIVGYIASDGVLESSVFKVRGAIPERVQAARAARSGSETKGQVRGPDEFSAPTGLPGRGRNPQCPDAHVTGR